MWLHTRGLGCDRHMDAADTPISEILAARMQPPRNGELYMGLFKFQFHELAAVRAKDPTFSPSAADIDTLFASPGKALFDAALYDVPAIPREIARDCLVTLCEETGDRSPGQVFLKCCERLRALR